MIIDSYRFAAGGGGGATTPTQRGSATTKAFGVAYPVSAPSGLAAGDLVIMAIKHADSDSAARSVSGLSSISTFNNGTQYVTILQGVMGGSPPSNWTLTNGVADDEVVVTAWSGATTTGQNVGTPNTTAPGGSNPVVTGVVAADASIGMLFACTQADVTAVTDMTQLDEATTFEVWTGSFDGVTIGSQTVTVDNPWTSFFLGVVLTIPGV